MRHTIGHNQGINFKNVISRYYETDKDGLAQIFQEFLETILELGYTVGGDFFYSMNSGPFETVNMRLQLFLPVNEEHIYPLPEGFFYHSYFQVTNVTATRVKGDSEAAITEGVYRLARYVQSGRFKEKTPIFYFVKYVDDEIYTDLMVGLY